MIARKWLVSMMNSSVEQIDEYSRIYVPKSKILKGRFHRQTIVGIILWCAIGYLMVIGSLNIRSLKQYSPISIRYDIPISGNDAYHAREYSTQHKEESIYHLTFWEETNSEIANEFICVNATCIYYNGDVSVVRPLNILCGTSPGATDNVGCMVSSGLAHKIFGGTDIIGMNIDINGYSYKIRGVFKEDDILVLASIIDEDTSHSYSAVELSSGLQHPYYGDIETYMHTIGLGKPTGILMGSPTFIAEIFTILPIIILAVYWLLLLIQQLKKYSSIIKNSLFFIVLLIFTMILPVLLDLLPGWMIPTHWSNFSYWSNIILQIKENLNEYITIKKFSRDISYTVEILTQLSISLPATICSILICYRWHRVNAYGTSEYIKEH